MTPSNPVLVTTSYCQPDTKSVGIANSKDQQILVIKKLDSNGNWKTFLPKLKGKDAIAVSTNFSKQVNSQEMLLYADFGDTFRIGNLKL